MKVWQLSVCAVILCCGLVMQVCCQPASERTKRQTGVAEERQFIGGLSTLGALIQPILFMVGMANFMGRIPMFFNRMRDRFSSTLAGTGAPAGAGRKRRSLPFEDETEEKTNRALRMLSEADEKYER